MAVPGPRSDINARRGKKIENCWKLLASAGEYRRRRKRRREPIMSATTLEPLLRYLRGLGPSGESAAEDSDGVLLERFARTRDEEAFRALLHRHGAMVWGVCR